MIYIVSYMIHDTSFLHLVWSAIGRQLTVLSISLVWAAEMQKRALDSMMGVAGKPTTTVPMFLFNISRPNALKKKKQRRHLDTGQIYI